MKNFDNLTDFTYFPTIDEMPAEFTGNFAIPRTHFQERFYMRYPNYWTEFEHRGSIREGVLTIDGEPMPSMVLMYKKSPENP